MATKLSAITKDRIAKLKEIRKLGINPYPPRLDFDRLSIHDVLSQEGKEVGVAGRVMGWRGHGDVIFADVVDSSGKIQAFFQKKNLKGKFDLLNLVDLGDFVAVHGKVMKTIAGEVSVDVAEFQILAKAVRPLPSKWYGLKDVEDRYRKRYLDILFNPEVKKRFETRTSLVREVRRYLDNLGFMEVETPNSSFNFLPSAISSLVNLFLLALIEYWRMVF